MFAAGFKIVYIGRLFLKYRLQIGRNGYLDLHDWIAKLIFDKLNLVISFCVDIDVTQPGSSLSSVDLSGCQQLTSTCIRHLTEMCGPTLQNLSVSNTGVCTMYMYHILVKIIDDIHVHVLYSCKNN